MPQVTVYIRNEDLDLWKSVEKKAEFLSSALRTFKFAPEPPSTPSTRPLVSELTVDPQDDPDDSIGDSFVRPDVKVCKHGYSPRMCKFAKNGKPCK